MKLINILAEELVVFHGDWVYPDPKHIKDQLRLAACKFNISFDELVEKINSTDPEPLSNNVWHSLDNSVSWGTVDEDDAKAKADEYGFHYNDAYYGFTEDGEVTLPIIINNSYLVSGEVELMFAKAFKLKPKVIMINV